MNNILEIIYCPTWPDLINRLIEHSEATKIYRGQSNNYDYKMTRNGNTYNREINFNQWKLISSFNRYYSKYEYLFRTYLKQQFSDSFFKQEYGNYSFREIFFLKDCNIIERLYYLQHYGVQTCLMDFTKDPLIATYFAIASVKANNGGPMDSDDNPYFHPNEPYISIYEVDYKKMADLLGIKELKHDSIMNLYDDYDMYGCHIALDIDPLQNCQTNSINENLSRQKGCFILFDNNNNPNYSLEIYIQNLLKKTGINSDETLIREYRLPYNKIFHKGNLNGEDNLRLFNFLDKQKATGKTLFNDINGLKFDLNFFHNR
jgi:hypothetical protein